MLIRCIELRNRQTVSSITLKRKGVYMVFSILLSVCLGAMNSAFAHGPGHHHGEKSNVLKHAKSLAVLALDFRKMPQEIATSLTDASKCEQSCREAVLRQQNSMGAKAHWVLVSPKTCNLRLKENWIAIVFEGFNPMETIGTVDCRYTLKE